MAKLLGVEGDYVAHGIDAVEAEEVIEKITKNGKLNARQAVEAAKEAFGKGITPDFPPDVNQMPADPSADYSIDQSVERPVDHSFYSELDWGSAESPKRVQLNRLEHLRSEPKEAK